MGVPCNIPNNMFVYRKRKRLTQDELATAVGVSQPRISNIESCVDDMPPLELLTRIATVIAFPGDPQELQSQFVPARLRSTKAAELL